MSIAIFICPAAKLTLNIGEWKTILNTPRAKNKNWKFTPNIILI